MTSSHLPGSSAPTDDRPLDAFESALLTELRSVVTGQSSSAEPPSPSAIPDRRRRGPRWLVAVAAVAAGITGLTFLPGGGSPAYAVSSDFAGDVTVTVNRLEGAPGLEKALADKGIHADVTYLPAGKQCADGRFTPAQPTSGLRFGAQMGSDGSQSFTIPANAVGPGQTLVLSSMWPSGNAWALQMGIAAGAVAPCAQVPADLPPAPGPGTSGGSGSQSLQTSTVGA